MTQSVDMDLQINNGDANIANFINNHSIMNAMKIQFDKAKRMLYPLYI